MVSTTDFIAAIEIGSSKIAGMAGRKAGDGSIEVLAYAEEQSGSFIRKGTIYNLDKTAQALTSIINTLEGSLGNEIGKVYVGMGGQSLRTVRNLVGRDLKEDTIISQELIDSICDENLAIPLIDMDILDVAPQEYKIGNNLQADPVGVASSHIEGRFLKINIADLFISPLVMAEVVLTEGENRAGCALVDFGADTTTISIYKNNILRFLTVLPLGGNAITRDVTTLQIEEEDAEKLKKQFGNALFEEEEEPVECQTEDGSRSFELQTLNNIIEARAEEIAANVWNQIQLSGFDDKLNAGIIITGGGSNLKNMDELIKRKSKAEKVKVARFVRHAVHASTELLKKDGTQNTILGILFAGEENCCLEEKPVIQKSYTEAAPVSTVAQKEIFEEDEFLKQQEEKAKAAKKLRDEEEKRKKEEERLRKIEEKKRKEAEKANRPGWFKSTFDKISNEIFSDDDMK